MRERLAQHGIRAELVTVRTSGDEGRGAPRAGLAVKGLFTREIDDRLLSGSLDCAVHSLKDLMIALTPGLTVAAFVERADPRDALVTRREGGLDSLPDGASVGTSSVRRRAALLAVRPDLKLVSLRGNVPTRVARVDDGTVDAVVVALAGVSRLGLGDRAVPLDPAVVVPAAGQGTIAVEVRAHDQTTVRAVRALDDASVRVAVTAERAALGKLETGCNVPIGAVCLAGDDGLQLRVTVYAHDGSSVLTTQLPVDSADPAASGAAAADDLLARGAAPLIAAAASAQAEEGSRGP